MRETQREGTVVMQLTMLGDGAKMTRPLAGTDCERYTLTPETGRESDNPHSHLKHNIFVLLVRLGLDLLCEPNDGLELGVVGVLSLLRSPKQT